MFKHQGTFSEGSFIISQKKLHDFHGKDLGNFQLVDGIQKLLLGDPTVAVLVQLAHELVHQVILSLDTALWARKWKRKTAVADLTNPTISAGQGLISAGLTALLREYVWFFI